MRYKTVLVHEHTGCCGGVDLTQAIQRSLDDHSGKGWILITAYQQTAANKANCNSAECGAVLIFAKRN